MKKYLPLLLSVIFLIAIGGCTKENNPAAPVVPIGISIQNISYPSFQNSTWNNVIGGTVLMEFDQTNSKDSVISRINDSVNLQNISGYYKNLSKGVYNINISSKNLAAAADTFIRFKAQIKGYSVEHKQAVSLTATTTDGLITIGKSFVQDNQVPVFKTDSGSQEYKMGLSNGFYYLYVRGGVKGTILFKSKATSQSVSKNLNVASLTQYNMEVVASKGSLHVVFTPFTYNQVSVSSSTLVTINVDPGDYYFQHSSNTYFVATDESGNILNEVKYVQGTKTFKLSSLQPFENDRFNLYVILVPQDVSSAPNITGFLQVKKGSTYNSVYSVLPQKDLIPVNPHLKNVTGFDNLLLSTEGTALVAGSPADTAAFTPFVYTQGSQLMVQMLENNQYTYNFFDIPAGTTNLNIDLSQVNKTPQVKTITAPASNFSFTIYAKRDTAFLDSYVLTYGSSQTGHLDIYYPVESFPEYDTDANYSIGGFQYEIVTTGPAIPDQIGTFDASFNLTGSNLATFVPSFTGTFDYYHASFLNATGPNLKVDLYSPSAGNYTNLKFPDFSKYLGLTNLDLSAQSLSGFELVQYQGFNEQHFGYKPAFAIRSASNFNAKAVRRGN